MKGKAVVRSGKKIAYILCFGALTMTILLIAFAIRAEMRADTRRQQVVIAVPYSEWVQDFESNYYTGWLEEKSGCEISFVRLDEGYERESLHTMLTSENCDVDAVFLPENQEFLSAKEYREYIREGYLCAPQRYLTDESRLSGMREAYPEVDFGELLGDDGQFYCFPSLKMSQTGQNMQVLWINIDWLTRLQLTIPRTTEEFRQVLRAFRDADPNGNGIKDELPLISCEAKDALKSYRYLMNAFVYYDGAQTADEESEWETLLRTAALQSAAEQENTRQEMPSQSASGQSAFTDGVAYCRMLYEDGLLVEDTFTYTPKQLMELVNDPADLVGAFSSRSIADVIYTNNPGVLAHFVQLAPLSSEWLEKGCAIRSDIFPNIGGLIPAGAKHKEEAARIMDLMLSKEAAPIALYGEEGVDWRFSKDGELSTYGTRAVVTTIRYLKSERQNQNYAGIGPLAADEAYMDGVTWNGDHSMTEYIDARAVKAYESYYVQGVPHTWR